jgi:glycolate oxidase iron-sulfur subunit
MLRTVLLKVLPDAKLFRMALLAGLLAKPLIPLFRFAGLERIVAMLSLAPARLPRRASRSEKTFPAPWPRRGRVALLSGCIVDSLAPEINTAAIRVLNRHGFDVVLATGERCCGSLAHHMGDKTGAHAAARLNIAAWKHEIEGEGLDAIVTTASGCGTTMKDYGFMLRSEDIAEDAARVSGLVRDISEFISEISYLRYVVRPPLAVAYHSACSLQHGQKITTLPLEMLAKAGFAVREIPEGHICCGSAGTYNLLQPELANRLRDRKIAHIQEIAPDLIAAGNIGCITQIAAGIGIPVVHPIELIDWATGGPAPRALESRGRPI